MTLPIRISCRWCSLTRIVLPSGILICASCDLTPASSIPIIRKPRP